MTPDEINERAWQQMKALTDEEVWHHPAMPRPAYDENIERDIWDARIALRDFFFNEMYSEFRENREETV